jgi:hypothetical protein
MYLAVSNGFILEGRKAPPALLPFPCNGIGGWELIEFERLEEVVDGRVHIFGAYVYEHHNEITDETKQIGLTRSLGSYSL